MTDTIDEQLTLLVSKFPLFSNVERQEILAETARWNDDKKEKLKEGLIEGFKGLAATNKDMMAELEKLQHEKINPLFRQKEAHEKKQVIQKAESLLDRLN